MNLRWLVCLLLPSLAGCTSVRLRESTISQGGTITDIQYRQVLNNLAMFSKNPWAIPSQINLRDGSAQIADVGQGEIGLDVHRAIVSHPGLLGSRTVVEQWSITPVTDETELKLLQIAYRRALGWDDSLTGTSLQNDLANELAHELKKQSPDLNEYQEEPDHFVTEARSFYLNHRMRDISLGNSVATNFGILSDLMFPYRFRFNDPATGTASDFTFGEGRRRVMSVVDDRIIYPNEPIGSPAFDNHKVDSTSTQYAAEHRSYVPPFPAELRRQVNEIEKDLRAIPSNWFYVGGKRDVPKDACYVGRCKDCYVWVCSEGLHDLSDFTLKILEFSSIIKDTGILTVPGPRFTPASGFPTR